MLEWEGKKHPDTPQEVHDRLVARDRLRRVLKAFCKICDATISRDEQEVRELVFECGDPKCYCKKTQYATKIHQVCDGCFRLHEALYFNKGLKDPEYFKKIDEAEKKAKADFDKRWKKE